MLAIIWEITVLSRFKSIFSGKLVYDDVGELKGGKE